MNIVGISGSLRQGSQNTALLYAIEKQMSPFNVNFEVASIDLPLYTGNESKGEYPEAVSTFREKVGNADGLIITCPEYNWNMTTALKNAIDWLSLGGPLSPLNNHVVALAGVGGGRLGSVRAQMATRQTLLHNKVWIIPGPEVLIAPGPDTFDENGELKNEISRSLINDLLKEFIRVIPLLKA